MNCGLEAFIEGAKRLDPVYHQRFEELTDAFRKLSDLGWWCIRELSEDFEKLDCIKEPDMKGRCSPSTNPLSRIVDVRPLCCIENSEPSFEKLRTSVGGEVITRGTDLIPRFWPRKWFFEKDTELTVKGAYQSRSRLKMLQVQCRS